MLLDLSWLPLHKRPKCALRPWSQNVTVNRLAVAMYSEILRPVEQRRYPTVPNLDFTETLWVVALCCIPFHICIPIQPCLIAAASRLAQMARTSENGKNPFDPKAWQRIPTPANGRWSAKSLLHLDSTNPCFKTCRTTLLFVSTDCFDCNSCFKSPPAAAPRL